jgi:hypothetical protein
MKKRQVSIRLTPREHRVLLFAAMLEEQSPSDFIATLLRSLPIYAKSAQTEAAVEFEDAEPPADGRHLELVK